MKSICTISLLLFTMICFGQKEFEIKILNSEMRRGSSTITLDLVFINNTNDTVFFIYPSEQFFSYEKKGYYNGNKRVFEQVDFCYSLTLNGCAQAPSVETNLEVPKTFEKDLTYDHLSYLMVLRIAPNSDRKTSMSLDNKNTKQCMGSGSGTVQIIYEPKFKTISREEEAKLIEIENKLVEIKNSYNEYIKDEKISDAEMNLNYVPAPALPKFVLRGSKLVRLIVNEKIKSNLSKINFK